MSLFKKESEEVKHNRESAKKFGWTPQWFQTKDFDDELTQRVKDFQIKYQLLVDGKVGPVTLRRKQLEMDAINVVVQNVSGNVIYCDGFPTPIEWDKVVLWKKEPKWSSKDGSHKKVAKTRKPSMFIVHWDVCLSSESCMNVLNKTGLSVHFLIDNDGTIIQTLDTQHIGYHAGNKIVNERSVGVEISNAYYPKFQQTYEMKGFGKRPVLENVRVHQQKLDPFLGFYPVQIDALKALIKALFKGHGIKLEVPLSTGEKLLNTVSKSVEQGSFQGVASHYHVTERKIDCAGLPLKEIVDDVKNSLITIKGK